MNSATIYFSDGTSLVLHENDLIIPIILSNTKNDVHSTADQAIMLKYDASNGLMPPIMDALCKCDFFYINPNFDVAYSSHAIVRVEAL